MRVFARHAGGDADPLPGVQFLPDLEAPLRPVLALGHALLGGVEKVDLVKVAFPAHVHDRLLQLCMALVGGVALAA